MRLIFLLLSPRLWRWRIYEQHNASENVMWLNAQTHVSRTTTFKSNSELVLQHAYSARQQYRERIVNAKPFSRNAQTLTSHMPFGRWCGEWTYMLLMQFRVANIQSIRISIAFVCDSICCSFFFIWHFNPLQWTTAHSITNRPDDIRLQLRWRSRTAPFAR